MAPKASVRSSRPVPMPFLLSSRAHYCGCASGRYGMRFEVVGEVHAKNGYGTRGARRHEQDGDLWTQRQTPPKRDVRAATDREVEIVERSAVGRRTIESHAAVYKRPDQPAGQDWDARTEQGCECVSPGSGIEPQAASFDREMRRELPAHRHTGRRVRHGLR